MKCYTQGSKLHSVVLDSRTVPRSKINKVTGRVPPQIKSTTYTVKERESIFNLHCMYPGSFDKV